MSRPINERALREALAANVRALRNAAGLSVPLASERAEMHWRMWQKIESAQVSASLAMLARLAQVLGVRPMELLREPLPASDRIVFS